MKTTVLHATFGGLLLATMLMMDSAPPLQAAELPPGLPPGWNPPPNSPPEGVNYPESRRAPSGILAPEILCHPADVLVRVAQEARFQVRINHSLAKTPTGDAATNVYSIEWQYSPGSASGELEWRTLDPAKPSPGGGRLSVEEQGRVLLIAPVSYKDVGFYRVRIRGGGAIVESRKAQLLMYTTTNPTTVWAAPQPQTPPTSQLKHAQPPPPGITYNAFACFKPGGEWFGFVAGQMPRVAKDYNTNITMIEYLGSSGDTAAQLSAIGVPTYQNGLPYSSAYQFYVYFPQNFTPSTPYSLTLYGFSVP